MEHDKLRKELETRYKNIAKNMEYSPMVGCGTMVDGESKNSPKTDPKICKHRLYGCIGGFNSKTAHKSEASKHCTFSGKSKIEIKSIRDAYFKEYPYAKAEYERMYPGEATKDTRKRKGSPGKRCVSSLSYDIY